MRSPIVLCADSFSVRFPEVMGLSGESLSSQSWLKVFSDGEEARSYVAQHDATPEVWVLGSDDMEAINIAAAIKADCCAGAPPASDCAVYLVTDDGDDMPHRAQAADLDGILSPRRFLCRYAEEKAAWAQDCDVYLSLVQGQCEGPRVPVATLPDVLELLRQGSAARAERRRREKAAGAGAGELAARDGEGGEVAREAAAAGEEPPRDEPPRAEQPRDAAAESAACAVHEEPLPMRQESPTFRLANEALGAEPTRTQEAVRASEAPRATLRQALLLPVVSASGGVGKSTIAVLCALAAAQHGLRTLLVDADFQFGDTAAMLASLAEKGRSAGSFEDVLNGAPCVQELAASVQAGVPAVLGALRNPERAEECPDVFAGVLNEALRRFDVVVVNTTARWSEVQAALIERATRVLYVLDQRPSAIRDATRALGLCAKCGLPTGAFSMVLNRCRRGAVYSAVDIASALKGFAVAEVQDGGMEVEELAASGRAHGLVRAYNPMARSVAELMAELLPKDTRARDAEEGLERRGRAQARRRGLWGKRGEPCPF